MRALAPVAPVAVSAPKGTVQRAVRPHQQATACGCHQQDDARTASEARHRDFSGVRSGSLLQAKLRVGAVNDPLEAEADRVADRVLGMPAPAGPMADLGIRAGSAAHSERPHNAAVQRLCKTCEDEPDHAARIQRKAADSEEAEDETEDLIQAKGHDGGDVALGRSAESAVERGRTGGVPLPASERAFFETRFGHDFSQVRVHSGGSAAAAAHAIGAHAFTLGRDVVFGAGQYAPGTLAGRRLLAHELTHVVQQGHAQRTGATSAVGPLQADSVQRAVIRRKPGDPVVGDTFVIETPKGGPLMLRVQPTADRNLKPEACGGGACPNSVGNVRSGTRAKITEKRQFGWYVVKVATIEHGERTGFVEGKYLTPITAAPKDKPAAPAVDEAPDIVSPEEAEGTPVFDLGDAALEAMEQAEGEGTPIEQLGVVQTDDGANLWTSPAQGKPLLGLLSQNTKVFVDRKLSDGWASVYVEGHQRGGNVPVTKGTHGYVQANRVDHDMPDPDAWLHRITKPSQGALALAAEVYPDAKPDCIALGHACRDHRYLVNVLVAVNEAKGRKYIYKEKPGDSWDQAKTMKATQGAGGKVTGGQIWVPGKQLVDAMHTVVSSGSITREILSTLADVAIGIAAFVVGLLHGALMSIADIFIGIKDLVVLAYDLIKKLINGTLIADAKKFWEDIKGIKLSTILDLVGEKWNAPSVWDRWKFRGYVIGYAVVEILLLFFSAGIVTAVKTAAKAGKMGKFAKYLSEFASVKKLIAAAEAAKGKTVDRIRSTMKAAEAISEAHGWAAQALRLPLAILRRLSDADIGKLKKLPQWAREKFAKLTDAVKLRFLGCNSPCAVDVHKIELALKGATTAGTKLLSPNDVTGMLKKLSPTFKIDKISRKLRKKSSAIMTAIEKAGLTDADFAALVHFIDAADKANPAQAYKTFIRYINSVVPAKVGPDIDKLNDIASAIVKAEKGRGAAMKGPMFEQWVALHVPAFAGKGFKRHTFELPTWRKRIGLPAKRQVDTWDPTKGEIWDMKHHTGRAPTNQADDYSALVKAGAKDDLGNVVKQVNYLFPTLDAAKKNAHLVSTYGHRVWYVDLKSTTGMLSWP